MEKARRENREREKKNIGIRLDAFDLIDTNKKKKKTHSTSTTTTTKNTFSADKKQLGAPLRIGEGATFHSLSTDAYTLHCLESPTGLKFVLTTTTTAATENEGGGGSSGGTIGAGATTTSQQQDIDVRDVLARIYAYAYVDGAARSPAFRRGEPFNFRLFSERLRACLGPMVST